MTAGPTHGSLLESAAEMSGPHMHRSVTTINDHELKVAVNEVPYRWHRHLNSDELLVVIEGRLRVEFTDRAAMVLGPMEYVLIPAGTAHKTSPSGRTVNLIVEKLTTHTEFLDDAGSDRTAT